jgi:hypothetical protein
MKKKYGIKNIRSSFVRAGQNIAEARKKKIAYLNSPEYKKKLAAARKAKLDELDYQIALRKKQQQLNKTITGNYRVGKSRKKPLPRTKEIWEEFT